MILLFNSQFLVLTTMLYKVGHYKTEADMLSLDLTASSSRRVHFGRLPELYLLDDYDLLIVISFFVLAYLH